MSGWLLPGMAFALVLASGFGHGGEILWGQGLVTLAGAVGLIGLATAQHCVCHRSLRLAAVAWALVVAWCIAQALPLGVAVHPSWVSARSILSDVGPGAIAIDPQATVDAAIRLAAYAGVFALGLTMARQPGGGWCGWRWESVRLCSSAWQLMQPPQGLPCLPRCVGLASLVFSCAGGGTH